MALHIKDLLVAQQRLAEKDKQASEKERMSLEDLKKLMGVTAKNTEKTTDVLTAIELLNIHTNIAQQEQIKDEKTLIQEDEGVHTRLDDIKSTLERSLIESKIQSKTLEKLEKGSANPRDTMEATVEAERARDEEIKTLKQIRDKLDKGAEEKPEKDKKVGDGGIGGILAAAAVALGAAVGAIQGYVTSILRINKALLGAFDDIIHFLGKKFPSIFGGLRKLIMDIKITVVLGLGMIKDAFVDIFDKVKGVFSTIKDFFSGIIEKIMNSKVIKFISGIIETISSSFLSFFGEIGTEIKTIENAASPLTNIIKGVREGFGKFFGFFGDIFDFVRGIGSKFETFSTIFKSVGKIVSKLMWPLTVVMTIWDTVKGAIEGYEKEGIVGAISGAIEGLLSSIVTAPLDLLKGAVSWILEKFGFENASKFLDSFSFDDIMKQFVDAIFHPIDTIKKMFEGALEFFDKIYIPEIGFTIPVIDEKVSIGPFYPFRREKTEGESSASAPEGSKAKAPEAATPTQSAKAVTPVTAEPLKTVSKPNNEVMAAPNIQDTNVSVQVSAPETAERIKEKTFKAEYNKALGEGRTPEQAKMIADEAVKSATVSAPAPQTVQAIPPTATEATAVYNKSAENQKTAIENQGTASAPVVINAPSTVNNSSKQNITMPAPVRNQDSGYNRYVGKNIVFA